LLGHHHRPRRLALHDIAAGENDTRLRSAGLRFQWTRRALYLDILAVGRSAVHDDAVGLDRRTAARLARGGDMGTWCRVLGGSSVKRALRFAGAHAATDSECKACSSAAVLRHMRGSVAIDFRGLRGERRMRRGDKFRTKQNVDSSNSQRVTGEYCSSLFPLRTTLYLPRPGARALICLNKPINAMPHCLPATAPFPADWDCRASAGYEGEPPAIS